MAIGDIRSPLGEARAEKDALLDTAFIQTTEYDALLQQRSGYVVVGRRGTGKSALFRELKRSLSEERNHRVITLEPDGNEVYPLHSVVQQLATGANYDSLHEVATHLCRYSILIEVLSDCVQNRPACLVSLDANDKEFLDQQVQVWTQEGIGLFERLYGRVRSFLTGSSDPGALLGELNRALQYRRLLGIAQKTFKSIEQPYALLADRLDEGFRPEDIGVAFVNGLVSASTELTTAVPQIRPTIFIRDNIFRAIQQKDRNYTRNVEGQVMRLHWSAELLLKLVAARMRIAFQSHETDLDEAASTLTDQGVWNRNTSSEYRGPSGFRKVLELTLYRPRDLIILLNIAFFEASKRKSLKISPQDVELSAEEVSRIRLEDLIKEYAEVIPGLGEILGALSRGRAYISASDALRMIEDLYKDSQTGTVRETIKLYGGTELLHELHSIGFFGYREGGSGTYTFCHDGRLAGITFGQNVELMVHPCYWRAVKAESSDDMAPEVAEQIHDDYNERYEVIDVTSVALERRQDLIRRVIEELDSIPIGENDEAFYAWAAKSLGILLSTGIRDLERDGDSLHGRITSTRSIWRDIQAENQATHLLFLLRNINSLTVTAISDAYARSKRSRDAKVIFLCTRATEDVIRKGPELEAIKQHFKDNGVAVAHITAKTICRSLQKLRDPASDSEPGRFVRNAIEQTIYSYGQSQKPATRRRKQRKSRGPICDVLLVVATPTERDAVLDLFLQEHGCVIRNVFGQRRTYFSITGLDSTKIFLVESEMGSGGVGASYTTVRDSIEELNPYSIVMVGMAFGFKPRDQKIGQILVSKQLHAYESQRVNTAADGSVSFTPRGDRVHASSRLVSRLRAAEYDWTGKVSFGLLLSGEKLIDNIEYRKQLAAQEPEAIGGEMEGNGLYVASSEFNRDWVIVKAICDWADGLKDDQKEARQREAASRSAAFVVHAIAKGGFAPNH